jgi:MOSC domain-containing protein YiiM
MEGVVASLNVNPNGGVPKLPVAAVRLERTGASGDLQRDLRHHGGPLRAVCLFAVERIRELQAAGHPIAPGSTGENLTIEGLEWARLQGGQRLRVGDALLELTSTATPCQNIAASFSDGGFERLLEARFPGGARWYAAVVEPGLVRTGDTVACVTK